MSAVRNDSVWPGGLRYQPDFVSPEQEHALIPAPRPPLAPFQFGGRRKAPRCLVRWRYDYSRKALEPADGVPEWLGLLATQIEQFAV
jgi:hypothetical protein